MTNENAKKNESNAISLVELLTNEYVKRRAIQEVRDKELDEQEKQLNMQLLELGNTEKTRNEKNIIHLFLKFIIHQRWHNGVDVIDLDIMIDIVKAILKSSAQQKNTISEDAKKDIDEHITKRLGQLFDKGGEGYIG